MTLRIGYLYPDLLNLYGDSGNIETLVFRTKSREIDVEVFEINSSTRINSHFLSSLNLIFMGGGPDSSQKELYKDLLENKGPFIKDYLNSGGLGLFICGSYQLLGEYYKTADGTTLPGLNVFDLYTQHFGNSKPRCIGNTVCKLADAILHDPMFHRINPFSDKIVGFENHGGRTYLKDASKAFAHVVSGHGNNSEDSTEGFIYKNSFGSYFHGPILVRNPHFADYLIIKALNLDELPPLDDTFLHKSFELGLEANP